VHRVGEILERGAIRAGIIEINDQLLALRGGDRDTLLELLRESGLRPEPLEPADDLKVGVDVAFRADRRLDAAGASGQLAVAHRRVVSRALWIPARVPAAATQVR